LTNGTLIKNAKQQSKSIIGNNTLVVFDFPFSVPTCNASFTGLSKIFLKSLKDFTLAFRIERPGL
jgi:hypothetical protein